VAVTFTAERAEFASATDASVYNLATAGAFTPTAGGLLVCVVEGAKTADATFDLTSVTSTGMSLTWTKYATVYAWTNTQFYRLHVLTAPVGGSPASVTAVNANWDQTILACDGWIGEFAGANTTTPIKQTNSATNASGTDPTVSMSVAPDSDSMSLVAVMTRRNPPAWTNAGWTEDMDTGVSTPVTGLSIYHLAATQAFTGTSGTDAANFTAIYEIDAASTVTTVQVTTPGVLTITGQSVLLRQSQAVTAGVVTLTGQTPLLRTSVVTNPGAITLTGQTVNTSVATVATITPGALTLAGQSVLLRQSQAVGAGAITLTGQTVNIAVATVASVSVPGALTLAGQTVLLRTSIVSNPGAVTFTGQAVTTLVATVSTVTPGAITLTGQAVLLRNTVTTVPGALTLTGQTVATSRTVSVSAGALTLSGQQIALRTLVALQPGAITLTGQSVTTINTGDAFAVYTIELLGVWSPTVVKQARYAPRVVLDGVHAPTIAKAARHAPTVVKPGAYQP
jgi:adhesin HecA-like repeat protein